MPSTVTDGMSWWRACWKPRTAAPWLPCLTVMIGVDPGDRAHDAVDGQALLLLEAADGGVGAEAGARAVPGPRRALKVAGVLREQLFVLRSQSGGLSRLSRCFLRSHPPTLLLRLPVLRILQGPASVPLHQQLPGDQKGSRPAKSR